MQNAPGVETSGDQEDILRGTRQREFYPLPLQRRGLRSTAGDKFGPIASINAGIDAFAGVGKVPAMSGRPPPGKVVLKKNDRIQGQDNETPPILAQDVPKETRRRDGQGQTSAARSDAR